MFVIWYLNCFLSIRCLLCLLCLLCLHDVCSHLFYCLWSSGWLRPVGRHVWSWGSGPIQIFLRWVGWVCWTNCCSLSFHSSWTRPTTHSCFWSYYWVRLIVPHPSDSAYSASVTSFFGNGFNPKLEFHWIHPFLFSFCLL